MYKASSRLILYYVTSRRYKIVDTYISVGRWVVIIIRRIVDVFYFVVCVQITYKSLQSPRFTCSVFTIKRDIFQSNCFTKKTEARTAQNQGCSQTVFGNFINTF